jgi:5-methylcytosine-specific restriction protein A
MPGPVELIPREACRVYDLVREAGHDVSDWGNYAKGPSQAAANPRYCYDWAFVDPAMGVVLCLWHAELLTDGHATWWERNLRAYIQEARRAGGNANWITRATRADNAVQRAARLRWPVRVVVLEGQQRGLSDPQLRSSRVSKRLLDPVPWSVASYDWDSGAIRLERGALPTGFVDQFSIEEPGNDVAPRVSVRGTAFKRDGAVRFRALVRAAGRCEQCGTLGFVTATGKLYLETHHVVPLSEGGSDRLDNVVALCPNDHRRAHLGADSQAMRAELLLRASHRTALSSLPSA